MKDDLHFAGLARHGVNLDEFSPTTHIVTVDHLPEWVTSGDTVIKRGNKTVIRSLTQTEPRWRALWRKFTKLID